MVKLVDRRNLGGPADPCPIDNPVCPTNPCPIDNPVCPTNPPPADNSVHPANPRPTGNPLCTIQVSHACGLCLRKVVIVYG